jgi:hypothetical protein
MLDVAERVADVQLKVDSKRRNVILLAMSETEIFI